MISVFDFQAVASGLNSALANARLGFSLVV